MEEINVASWEEFIRNLDEIRSRDQPTPLPLLFRGQSNSCWPLNTTLDRATREGMLFREYYQLISAIKTEIETFTNIAWQIPEYTEVVKLVQDYDSFSLALTFGRRPAYEYMAYLRHHGFPSPLLDWSRSPYVAAFFAFCKPNRSNYVSIYLLSDTTFKNGGSDVARFYRFGSNVKVHRRHVLQQSDYTMCLIFAENKEWRFAKYDEALQASKIIDGVAWNFELRKFNIPYTERQKVLRSLDEHNLNAFSLFGSEESLMDAIAARKLMFS
jgi:hypothetical protein